MKKVRFVLSLVLMLALAVTASVSAYAMEGMRVYSPYTGDDANLGLMIALLCISAAVLAGAAFYFLRKKKNAAAQQDMNSMPDDDGTEK